MNSLKPQAEALKESWARAYSAVRANPSAYQPYLPGANAEQLNEVVETVLYWFDRVRPPSGFAPAFHLAKSLASSSLASAATASERLAAGEYGHFPTFLLSLTQVLAAMHSLIHFGERKQSDSSVADLGARLAESLSLLETAQRELSAKSTRLAESDAAVVRAEAAAEKAEELSSEALATLESIKALAVSASAQSTDVASSLEAAEELTSAIADSSKKSAKLASDLEKLQADVAAISAKAQEQQALITALLPKGASAGLASAFAMRVTQLERTKWIWMGAFGAAILGLSAIAIWVLYQSTGGNVPLWLQIVQRIPLAAPLVWLGWFSAVQYGNTLRVQEDYAFKEATAKAFAGFKDHLEHMASIAEEDGASAMTLLYRKTMDALAREPLRVFQGSAQDVAPSQAAVEAIKSLADALQSGKTGSG
jgi:hypothetical protein